VIRLAAELEARGILPGPPPVQRVFTTAGLCTAVRAGTASVRTPAQPPGKTVDHASPQAAQLAPRALMHGQRNDSVAIGAARASPLDRLARRVRRRAPGSCQARSRLKNSLSRRSPHAPAPDDQRASPFGFSRRPLGTVRSVPPTDRFASNTWKSRTASDSAAGGVQIGRRGANDRVLAGSLKRRRPRNRPVRAIQPICTPPCTPERYPKSSYQGLQDV
jgi:hypothetical protein